MSASNDHGWNLQHRYAQLPEAFFRRVQPTPVREPALLAFNAPLAASLGLRIGDSEHDGERASLATSLSGNAPLPNAHPIAQAYAGHQYAHFTMLGDGRAILLGEQTTPRGDIFDVQLKGAGPTPYSRGGDGRAALGPMLREYLISEAMHALGIPSTRSLAVVGSGEKVFRDGALPGAVLTRVARSHLRVGTFEYAARLGEVSTLRALADHALQRHPPQELDESRPYLSLLQSVIARQASLIAQWLGVGFVHGVMNTDNMSIGGETIDYGPCAFMDAYDPATVFSSIDRHGRYAYANQPRIAQWNLARFAESLLPLLDDDEPTAIRLAEEAISGFSQAFEREWLQVMRGKLGLLTAEEADLALVVDFLQWMQSRRADFTTSFRALAHADVFTRREFNDDVFRTWHSRWSARAAREAGGIDAARALMDTRNPAIIPRNHQVEAALQAASEHGDLTAFRRLLSALQRPFDDDETYHDLQGPPMVADPTYRTFCGT